jgi:hypothetical protein
MFCIIALHRWFAFLSSVCLFLRIKIEFNLSHAPNTTGVCLAGEGSLAWFANYLSQRVKCIKSEHLLSQPLPVTKGVQQSSILGPTLFSVYINNIAQEVGSSLPHLYVDDAALYSAGPSPDFVLNTLQQSFLSVQQAISAP